jgi:thiosulfate reductase cytochrome b subunit
MVALLKFPLVYVLMATTNGAIREYNESNTRDLFVYHSYMLRLLRRSHHQAVHQNCKKEIIYIKNFYSL